MNLLKKKSLAASVLGVGKRRIGFNLQRLKEIEDAMTNQDMRELFGSGAIFIKEQKGRRKIEKRKNRRGGGSIRKKIRKEKRRYIILTRKLRRYLKELLSQNKISKEQYLKSRKEIRSRFFKSKAHLKEHLK